MAKTAQDVLNVMRSWIGYSEYNGKYKKIIDLYNSVRPLPRGYAVKYWDEWCDTTVSAAGIKAGCTELIGRECGVEEHVKIFKQLGIWIEDGTIRPQAGDIIVFNWDQGYQPNNGYSDHIGIVEEVTGNTIAIIEGNSAACSVARRWEPVGWGFIRGYARPKYGAEGAGKPERKPVRDIAEEVIRGDWGNGPERRERLVAAGYNVEAVQKIVNEILGGTEPEAEAEEAKTEEAKTEEGEVKFYYAVRAEGTGILDEVCNLEDFAGVQGRAITDVAIKANIGEVKYRVHILGGGWLPWVYGCDWNDSENGYAGNGQRIDAIQVYYFTPEDYAQEHGYQKAQYRVAPLNGNYWDWQYDDETEDGQDGYAGAFGYAIDRFQLC